MTPLPPPSEVKPLGSNGAGQNGHGRGGPAPEPGAPELSARRNSPYPLLLDFGVVLALFGLIIVRPVYNPLVGDVAIGLGVVLAVVALLGWIREARAEYARLRD